MTRKGQKEVKSLTQSHAILFFKCSNPVRASNSHSLRVVAVGSRLMCGAGARGRARAESGEGALAPAKESRVSRERSGR